jgi:hypothetical protein
VAHTTAGKGLFRALEKEVWTRASWGALPTAGDLLDMGLSQVRIRRRAELNNVHTELTLSTSIYVDAIPSGKSGRGSLRGAARRRQTVCR